MGESVENASSPSKNTLEEYFEEACPYFMAIGMTYDEFWYKSPKLVKYFLKAHEIRQKQDSERLWLQGYYTYIALCCVSPVLHAFAKKGTKPLDYLKHPINTSKEEIEAQEQAERNKRLLKFREDLVRMSKKGGSNNG